MGTSPVLVIGASFAGCFAAAGLAQGGHDVIVLERDGLPSQPGPRRGVPQGTQPHVLLARGLQEGERLLPGLTERLRSAGAVTIDAGRIPWLTEWGWLTRRPPIEVLSMTRPLLEHVVRDLLLANPRVTLMDSVEVRSLTSSGGAWTLAGTGFRDLRAEVVVDASGRSSRLPEWLRAAGLPVPEETTIDARAGYATRLYEGRCPLPDVAVIQLSRQSLRGGIVLRVEHDQWLVAVVGCADKRPPRDVAGFCAALEALPDPVIVDAARALTPISDVFVHRQTANRRVSYERLRALPPGLLAVGDALCCFNPVYGQGITVAAIQGALLKERARSVVGGRSLLPLQRELASRTILPWLVSAGADAGFPTSDEHRTLAQLVGDGWGRRLVRAASRGDAVAAAAFQSAYHLVAPPRTLLAPRAVVAGVRGGTSPGRRPETLPRPHAFLPRQI